MAVNSPTTPWYRYPVTQAYGQNGETGIDIGTPVHTPLTALFGGTVSDVSYHAYGWQVVVDVPTQLGKVIKETFIHMDQVAVKVGQPVVSGTFLGLSGGEPPLTSPKYSSGPHTEFDLFTGTPFASSAYNPDALFQSLGTPDPNHLFPKSGSAGSGGVTSTPLSFDPCAWLPAGPLRDACDVNVSPGGPGTQIVLPGGPNPLGGLDQLVALLTNPSTWLRVGGAILGLLLVVVAVAAMLRKE